jgi:DNA repair protein RecO (recombination protein O)
MRISLQPTFILHHRPYRETSLLLDAFSQEHGRVSLIAKGVRTVRSTSRGLLQLFSPLLISWQGRSELMNLSSVESQGVPIRIQATALLSGFYLNELLMRLLPKYDPHPQLYTIYHNTLLELERGNSQQKHLRLFEKKLLEELGYGLQFKELIPDQFYRFYPEQGFVLSENNDEGIVFSGKNLLSLATEKLEDAESLRDAKRLMRLALHALLGPQPLHSRKLFTGVTSE